MNIVIFDTEEQATESQNQDFLIYIAQHENPGYINTTERWAEVKQREDGKWYYQVCPVCDYTGRTVVDYVESEEGLNGI